tara:strand:- start:3260 stop:4222 length:963 start_codon:yes stop_codon:yes gene_type:complete
MKIQSKDLTEDLKAGRPNVKDSTIKQYENNLLKLKKIFNSDSYDFLSNPKTVMEKLEDKHYLSQRNFLNSIVVLLLALDSDNEYEKLIGEYSTIRDNFNEKYTNENKNNNVISDKQSKNFGTIQEVYDMLNKMADDLKPTRKKTELTKKEMQLLQAYTLFSIYSRMPFRNDVADGTEAITKAALNKKSKQEQREKNWLLIEKNKLSWIMNIYKSDKTYGQKVIVVEDKTLKRILNHYIKINGHGVLFKTSSGKPLTRTELSKTLLKFSKKYSGKAWSSTILRKIYLSSKYGDMKKELEADNAIMGHSKTMALDTYVKEEQ